MKNKQKRLENKVNNAFPTKEDKEKFHKKKLSIAYTVEEIVLKYGNGKYEDGPFINVDYHSTKLALIKLTKPNKNIDIYKYVRNAYNKKLFLKNLTITGSVLFLFQSMKGVVYSQNSDFFSGFTDFSDFYIYGGALGLLLYDYIDKRIKLKKEPKNNISRSY